MEVRGKCDICGGNIVFKNGRHVCEACGAYTLEEITEEETANLFTANQKLRICDFEEAEKLFQDFIEQYPENPYGYWGLLRTKYGIIYEIDTNKSLVVSCYGSIDNSIYNNKYYKKACYYADQDLTKYFEKQAKKIEKIRKDRLEVVSKEKPYDIFISFKSRENENCVTRRTDDYSDACDIYWLLTKKGYRVFFSEFSLKGKTGEQFEPYIFNAINSAKIMIVYASKLEYLESTWIRNEYYNYIERIKNKEKDKNSLVLVFKDINLSMLPRSSPFRNLQCLNRDNIDFSNDLLSYVDKIIGNSYAFDINIHPEHKNSIEEHLKNIKIMAKEAQKCEILAKIYSFFQYIIIFLYPVLANLGLFYFYFTNSDYNAAKYSFFPFIIFISPLINLIILFCFYVKIPKWNSNYSKRVLPCVMVFIFTSFILLFVIINHKLITNILTVDEITYKKITALFGGYFWSYILLSLIAIDFILIILGIIFAVKYHQNKSINKYHCTDKNVDIKLKKKYQKCKRKYKTLTYDEFYNEFKDKKIYSSFPDY